MRQPDTDIPGLILRAAQNGARVAFLPADLDRRIGRDNLPDHCDLLANLVRWSAKSEIPLEIHGPGLLDCHLYRQAERLILHVVNRTNAGTWRQPVHELIPVGPCEVKLKLPSEVDGAKVRSLVSGKSLRSTVGNGLCSFEVPSILAHEVFVVG